MLEITDMLVFILADFLLVFIENYKKKNHLDWMVLLELGTEIEICKELLIYILICQGFHAFDIFLG
jgi:hypothetical protein